MTDSTSREIKEELAQLGIKKGSLVWPILAVIVATLILAVYLSPSDKSAISALYGKVCAVAHGKDIPKTTIEPLAKACFNSDELTVPSSAMSNQFKVADIITKWAIINELMGVDGHGLEKYGVDTWGEFRAIIVETAKDYTASLFAQFGQIIRGMLETALVAVAVSLIPGLVGMIYRRNFWGWFAVTFIGVFLITSGLFGQLSIEARVLVFLLSQLLVVLLALRLQRFSSASSPLSPTLHNWILAAILIILAASLATRYPNDLWNNVPWMSSWFYRWEMIIIGLPVIYSLLRRSDAWRGQTRKNIVMCLDGTTNTPDQFENGRLAQTNIFKLYKMLKSDPGIGAGRTSGTFNATLSKRYSGKQVAFYYSGVGNRFDYDPIVQALGGATGLGAANVVDRAYLDLLRVYRPGDRIFVFGFSRGAAIARLLARAIDQKGVPKTVWTLRLFGRHWTIWKSLRDGRRGQEVPVTVLGCFDTVGAFGIAKNIAGVNFQKLDLFKDLTVPDNVKQAYHMVALDELREEFEPTLMDPDPITPGRIIEVWFSGDHANIGGGWATTKLSDLTLDFLLKKISSGYAYQEGMASGDESWGLYLSAINCYSLPLDHPAAANAVSVAEGSTPHVVHPDPLGQVRLWRSALYVYKPRELPNHAIISESVFHRMANAAPLYAPASLFNLHDDLDNKRQAINSAVDRLKATESVTAEEYTSILEFKDKLHLVRWPHYAEFLAGLSPPPSTPQESLANVDLSAAGSG